MVSGAPQPSLLQFSTEELPPRERAAFWCEVFGRRCAHIEIVPRSAAPLQHRGVALSLPGIKAIWSQASTPACWRRTPQLIRDGNDDFALLVTVSGAMRRSQLGCDVDVGRNAAVAILQTEPAELEFKSLTHIGVMVPRAALAPYVRDLEDASTRLVPAGTEAIRLLRSYLTLIRDDANIDDPTLCQLVVTHVYDLIAMAIGATREGKEIALGRGVRIARLKAIKKDLDMDPQLTLAAIAERHGLHPRYVQRLFESDGTSFTAYTLAQRLQRVHRMLWDQRYASWKISDIALEAGFGDLSHFYRCFRRRYGASPSEIRAEATIQFAH